MRSFLPCVLDCEKQYKLFHRNILSLFLFIYNNVKCKSSSLLRISLFNILLFKIHIQNNACYPFAKLNLK